MAPSFTDIQQAVDDYHSWLESQPLSVNTQRAYTTQVIDDCLIAD